MFDIEPVTCEKLTLSAHHGRVKLAGSIEIPNPNKVMQPFLKKVHELMVHYHLKAVEVDLSELTFINSCGVKELVAWILSQDELDNEQKYQITFLCNPDFSWQELTITSVVWLNPDQIKMKMIR